MPIAWDDAPLGAETGRIEFTVTDVLIDDYLAAMQLDLPCFITATPPYDKRLAPPDMIPKFAMEPLYQDFMAETFGTNIRAKQVFKFFAPIPVGTTIHGVGHLVEKYERRERRFVTLEGLFTDDSGRALVLDRRTQMILGENFSMRT